MSSILEHPAIGKIQGKQGQGVVQYLGVRYGHLKDRFATAELHKYPQGITVDAMRHAPAVLNSPDAVDHENGLIQLPDPLPFTDRRVSDIDGLAINITVPDGVTSTSKLPLLAYIHGGGFATGSTNWPLYDFSNLVRRSVARGAPVIGIGINYRTGIAGFLYSSELKATGYKANRGLRDQKLALEWIKEYIAGFGGDPDNITIAGQSAGSGSVAYLLQQEEPLAKRAIMMSGTDLLMRASPESDDSYNTACKLLGLEGDAATKVKALVEYPALELLGKLGRSVNTGAVFDNDYIKVQNTRDGLLQGTSKRPSGKWIESVLIGDCTFDGSICTMMIPSSTASRFLGAANKVLPSTAAQTLAQIYGVSDSTPDDAAYLATLRFLNDIAFHQPTYAYANYFKGVGKHVYVYHFASGNPWPGRWQGEASHIVDVAFLFQNYLSALSAPQRQIAEDMGDRFLAFVAGEQPFEPWTGTDGPRLLFGPESVQTVKGPLPLPDEERRTRFYQLGAEVGYDKLAMVSGMTIAAQ